MTATSERKMMCPICHTELVKTHYQDGDDGGWRVCWKCECEASAASVKEWEEFAEKEAADDSDK